MDIRLERVVFTRPEFRLEADFTVASGAAVAVIGPSGSGKSTLLNLVAGFETPEAGRVLIGGRDMAGLGPGARPVTMLFQDNNLFPHLTVAQNVGLGRDPGLKLDREDRAAIDAVLEDVGLSELGARRPGALSGGQASRAALARALLRDRPVLLLDEPFAALGPALRRDMLALVQRIRAERGMTLMMVTHDPQDARWIAGEVVFVDRGRAEPPAETGALFADPPPGLAAYLGQ